MSLTINSEDLTEVKKSSEPNLVNRSSATNTEPEVHGLKHDHWISGFNPYLMPDSYIRPPCSQSAIPYPIYIPMFYPPRVMYSESTQTIGTGNDCTLCSKHTAKFEASSEPNFLESKNTKSPSIIELDMVGKNPGGDTMQINSDKATPIFSNPLCGDVAISSSQENLLEVSRAPEISKSKQGIPAYYSATSVPLDASLSTKVFDDLLEPSKCFPIEDSKGYTSTGESYHSDEADHSSDNSEHEGSNRLRPVKNDPPKTNFTPCPFSSGGGHPPIPPNPQAAMLLLNLLTSNRTNSAAHLEKLSSVNDVSGVSKEKLDERPFCQRQMERMKESFQRTVHYRDPPLSSHDSFKSSKETPRPNPFQPPGLFQQGHVHKVPSALCNDPDLKAPSPPRCVKHVRMNVRPRNDYSDENY